MATTNRMAETSSIPQCTSGVAGDPAAATGQAFDGDARWWGERWFADLLALALAGVLTGATAFAGLAVTSARVTSPHAETGDTTSGGLEAEVAALVIWDEQSCCQETR